MYALEELGPAQRTVLALRAVLLARQSCQYYRVYQGSLLGVSCLHLSDSIMSTWDHTQ